MRAQDVLSNMQTPTTSTVQPVVVVGAYNLSRYVLLTLEGGVLCGSISTTKKFAFFLSIVELLVDSGVAGQLLVDKNFLSAALRYKKKTVNGMVLVLAASDDAFICATPSWDEATYCIKALAIVDLLFEY